MSTDYRRWGVDEVFRAAIIVSIFCHYFFPSRPIVILLPYVFASLGYLLLQCVRWTGKLIFKQLYLPLVVFGSFAFLSRRLPFNPGSLYFWMQLLGYASSFVAGTTLLMLVFRRREKGSESTHPK